MDEDQLEGANGKTERDLANIDLAFWRRRIAEADTDEALDHLYTEAACLPEQDRRAVYLRIANARIRLRNRPPEEPIPAFAADLRLPRPDGRPLHAYRLDDQAFAKLQTRLTGKPDLRSLDQGWLPALFVLWASEWFRRVYTGDGYKWDGLIRPLGQSVSSQGDQAVLRQVAERGLAMWNREVMRLGGGRSFLGSLAREGGFPVAAFGDGNGWARKVLGKIIARLLSEPTAGEERAVEVARAQRADLPQTFGDEDFVVLCADLALAVVKVRREAEPAAAREGLPVLAWLGLNRPDWRMSLPIVTGDHAADKLIEGLMHVEAIEGAGVGSERLLWRQADGTWVEAARIALDGDVDSQTMRTIEGNPGRLRVFAAEDLARHLPGELGMLEPPAIGETRWTARSTRLARGLHAIPFAATLKVELRVGSRNLASLLLPGGQARRGQLLVAVAENDHAEAPDVLKVIGSGSGHYRAQTLFLQVPAGWQVTTLPEEFAEAIGRGAGATQLWRVRGGAFITDHTGDRYRIRCGQPTDTASRIDLIGTTCRWAEVTGNVDLFCGPPQAIMKGQEGRLYLREKGTRTWRIAPHPLPLGHYELGWRASDGIMLDRRTVAVLPTLASLQCQHGTAQPCYTLQGFGPVRLEPDENAPVIAGQDGLTWRSRACGARVHCFQATIHWEDGLPLRVTIRYPGEAAIAQWDGNVLPHNTELTLDDLRDLVGIDEGHMELHAELREARAGKVAQMIWEFDRELPLASIRDDCASLLLPASIDAELLLDMHNGKNTNWRLKPFALSLVKAQEGFVAQPAVADPDVTFCGRSLAAPESEVCFGSYSLLSEANHRPLSLPAGHEGDWLVYLRKGGSVLTRPIFAFGQGRAQLPASRLAQAMACSPGRALDAALHDVLTRAASESEDARELVKELVTLVRSLDGLPPATFRVLQLLRHHPVALTFMAYDDPEAVMPLSQALPFAWFLVPWAAWEEGGRRLFDDLVARLASLPGPDQVRYAVEEVKRRQSVIVGCEPLLAGLFDPPAREPIVELAQRFANRAIDRIRRDSVNRYRSRFGERLPAAFLNFDERLIDTFDAPCAAALAVAGEWHPDEADVRHMKTIARTFPTYFAEAITAWFMETTQ